MGLAGRSKKTPLLINLDSARSRKSDIMRKPSNVVVGSDSSMRRDSIKSAEFVERKSSLIKMANEAIDEAPAYEMI